MLVKFLPSGHAGGLYTFKNCRVPCVGEFIWANGDDPDGMPSGLYEVTRVTFEVRSTTDEPQATCVVVRPDDR